MSLDIKQLLGHLSPTLFRDYLETRGVRTDFEWDKLPRKRYGKELFELWKSLPAPDQQKLEPDLCDIASFAKERGVKGMIQTAAGLGVALHDELEVYESMQDKVLHVMTRHPHLWQQMVCFTELDLMATTRYWHTFPGLPKREIEDVDARRLQLETRVAEFFLNHDGTGRDHASQHMVRCGNIDYFFIYLSSYSESDLAVSMPDRVIAEHVRTPVFDVVFAYHRQSGLLEMMARGGKRVTQPLLRIFCKEIFGIEPPTITDDQEPFQLNLLLNQMLRIQPSPGDGLRSVVLRSLRLWAIGQGGRRLSLEGDPARGSNDVYDMIRELFRDGTINAHDWRVAGAKFTVEFDPAGPVAKRSLTFEVSSPRSDNLKDQPEAVRSVVHRLLRNLGIDQTEQLQDAADAELPEVDGAGSPAIGSNGTAAVALALR